MNDLNYPHEEEFTIHTIDSYDNMLLKVTQDYFSLDSKSMRNVIHEWYQQMTQELSDLGIAYSSFRTALVPTGGKNEIAYIFSTKNITDPHYGYALSEHWLNAIKECGPENTAIHHGDIIGFTDSQAEELVYAHVVDDSVKRLGGPYFVVYLTNMKDSQSEAIHEYLVKHCRSYVGRVDCTKKSPFKNVLLLPQYGLKHKNTIITHSDEDGNYNLEGYPVAEYGFTCAGVSTEVYNIFLGHKINTGSLEGLSDDAATILQAIGGTRRSVGELSISISESRLEYLRLEHGKSLDVAQLFNQSTNNFANAIKEELQRSMIYNIRFKLGTKDGKKARGNDAVLFSVQIELLDMNHTSRRYQVGIKYNPIEHSGEIVTFF